MTTIKVNERTKAGKALLEIAKLFSTDKKGVEIIAPEKNNKSKDYPVSKNIPNAETKRAMRNAEKGIGVKKFDSIDELFAELDS